MNVKDLKKGELYLFEGKTRGLTFLLMFIETKPFCEGRKDLGDNLIFYCFEHNRASKNGPAILSNLRKI